VLSFFTAENVATILRFLFTDISGEFFHGSSFLVMNEEGTIIFAGYLLKTHTGFHWAGSIILW